jgi:RNA polymerase sigma-70 factor, ECF subfamily
MEPTERAELEERIRRDCDRRAFDDAATAALRGYGPEILGYLVAVTRSESDAGDVFSMFCEDLWNGLPTFRWECTFRTWGYTLARHAWVRFVRDPHRQRAVPLSAAPAVRDLAAQVRTRTLDYLRSEVKDRVSALRAQLDPDDQALLVFRINRKLAWRDIARIMSDTGEDVADASLDKKAASLRKRFERIKDTLRELATSTLEGGGDR